MEEEREYLFVEGAVLADSYAVVDGRIRMSDESWSGVYGRISEFFAGKSICGWFICSGESANCNVGMIRSFMYENIGQDKRALIIWNTEIEEEMYSVYDQNVIREQQGYYLFYERNESMQAYMVTTAFAGRTDPVAVDAVTARVRTRTVEPREMPVQRGGYSFVTAAAMVLGVLGLAAGIVALNHYDKLRDLESVLTGITGGLLSTEDTGQESTEERNESQGGLIIEDVDGEVSPSEGTSEEETAGDISGDPSSGDGSGAVSGTGAAGEVSGNQSSGDGAGAVSGTGAAEDTSGNPSSGDGAGTDNSGAVSATEPESQPSTEGGAPSYTTYRVEKGDTLVTICWKLYGSRDDALIEKICEINKLENKDYIYVGQELLIP